MDKNDFMVVLGSLLCCVSSSAVTLLLGWEARRLRYVRPTKAHRVDGCD
jgi:hypothetical protein